MFFESTISQPNHVRSSCRFQENFLWAFHVDPNKQKNKQTNKQFCELTISQPNQVRSSKTFRKTFCGYLKTIQTNKQTIKQRSKQTNKQITNKQFCELIIFQPNHFLFKTKTSRKTSCGYPQMILKNKKQTNKQTIL